MTLHPSRSTAVGFSLVEFLITAAAIAILALLSIPAYQKAVNSADRTRCIEKLKFMGAAALRYAYDHQGQMPSADWNQPNGRLRTGTHESYRVRGGMLDYLADWRTEGSGSPTDAAWCPAARRAYRTPINAWRTYCLNSFAKGTLELNPDGTPAIPSYTIAPRLFSIPHHAQMAMFMDGVKPNFSGGYADYPATINASTFLNRQDSFYPHGGDRINVVFMDGHVGSMDKATLRTLTTADPFWSGGTL